MSKSSDMRMSRAGLTLERVGAFSDGVFSIAITILVFGLMVPVLTPDELAQGELFVRLFELWPKVLAYILTFSLISIFWVGHHIMFHFIERSDRMLLWLNSLLLMSIAFLPFPAGLLGTYPLEQASILTYGIALFAASCTFTALWVYASSGRRLIRSDMSERVLLLANRAIWLPPTIYLLAVLFGLIYPYASLAVYVIVPILYIIPSPIDEIVTAAE